MSRGAYPDGHDMVKDGFIPGIGHLSPARGRCQPIPLALLMRHAALSKEDNHITGHILNAVRGHTETAFEGHQQRPCTSVLMV